MWKRNGFVISTDKSLLDVGVIHRFIAEESYWGVGRSREMVAATIAGSQLCFGLYREAPERLEQVGYARVVGDDVVCGYIADVFVLEAWRGRGLGKWLIETVMAHPDVAKLRRVMLHTRTPAFYGAAGFAVFDQSGQSKYLERRKADGV